MIPEAAARTCCGTYSFGSIEAMEGVVRIGLVMRRGSLAAWQAEVIEQVTSSGAATVATVFEMDANAARHSSSLFYRWYRRVDRRLARVAHDPCAPVYEMPALAGAPRVALKCSEATLADDPLDVVLCLDGDEATARRLAPRARFGAWMGSQGEAHASAPPFLAEIREGQATTSVSIVQVRADGAVRVLDRIEVATEHGLSQIRNRVQPLWALASRLVGVIVRLHETGEVVP